MKHQKTSINLSRKTSILARSKSPSKEVSPRVPTTEVPPVPGRIGIVQKSLSKSGERVKNKSLIRGKRASLDAGADYVNEAEMVKNYY